MNMIVLIYMWFAARPLLSLSLYLNRCGAYFWHTGITRPRTVGPDPNGPDPRGMPIPVHLQWRQAQRSSVLQIRQQIAAERKFYFMGALRNVNMHSLLDHLTCRQNSFQLKERKDCSKLRSIDGPNRKPEKSS